ncbi:sigma-70 family RNA polymerase sigma factor [Streptomyces sp. W1SF4]|uniref:RNA polymerase sigma factor n=1 Tax=Streptomyces sp. W1SF4 TaxID=2305220 RepID=UPI000F6D43A6|nr:sigma-70 family RNA polymerase sigma factor [Streptomyces sp. W1SF4]AZM93907.1 sigma-70 family RNA polymerase sigma factor [Streptomyces sp. W1SF4]
MRNRSDPRPPLGAGPPTRPPKPPSDVAAEQALADTLDDGVLAVRASEGDEDAFAILVRHHSGRLLALARHLLGNRTDAEDAVQDAFLSAWRRLPEFRHSASFGTWMYRIVTNRCLNTLRHPPRPLPLDTLPEAADVTADTSPPQVAETSAAAAALAKALLGLRPELRVCWVLRELHGLHYDEIAHIVGCSEPTVRGRLFRARRALMEAMRPWR